MSDREDPWEFSDEGFKENFGGNEDSGGVEVRVKLEISEAILQQ